MAEKISNWVGRALPRFEDPGLLNGKARFIDDMSPLPNIKHIAFVRSSHSHARILDINTNEAKKIVGVTGILTGPELQAQLNPIGSAVKSPMSYFPIAGNKVRYVGEPIAVVAAENRYIAEDAAEAIVVHYEALSAVVDPVEALKKDAPVVHEDVGSNLVHQRFFSYGNPDGAFESSDEIIRLSWRYPKNSSTPIETYGIIAHFDESQDQFTIWSNFQGPFILQPLMARALGITSNQLRLISAPNSGGSFGIKQSSYPYLILLAITSRLLGYPVKWMEDRLEHLSASSSASDRADKIEAAFDQSGQLMGLRYTNLVNVGAYVRAPEPASVYRMHSASNSCYDVRNIAIKNQLVTTNKMPIGLNRGYGGPQFYFGLERAIDLAARKLNMDPADIRLQNLVAADSFPYETASGGVYDSGDYHKTLKLLLEISKYKEIRQKQKEARDKGLLFGIGLAAGVEPSGSNMAYVTLAQTPEERARAGGRSGATACATVSVDPGGSVTVQLDSTPAGQGHATVAAQIVADALGLKPEEIRVNTTLDTEKQIWSLASGNYANRFASIVVSAISESANRVANKLKKIAAELLEVAIEDIILAKGRAHITGVIEKSIDIKRLAAATHWNPASLPTGMEPGLYEKTSVSPKTLGSPDANDKVSSSATFGFLCDLAVIQIERETGRVIVENYVSVHDVGQILNPIIVEGQIRGGFAHGFGAAMFEELNYDENGNFLSGTFADYLCPTVADLPPLKIGHYRTDSPMNAFGSKGMGDGSSMLTPVTMANAVADALNVENIELPLNLERVWRLVRGRET